MTANTKRPIEFHYWPTPNGWKIAIALEEFQVPYTVKLVNTSKGEQYAPEFLRISPNNRMPAIVNPCGPDGEPVSVFESGAILQYLSQITGKFGGDTPRQRIAVSEWLMWQMGGLGPMAGQAHHFLKYAPLLDPPQVIPYAQNRYRNEVSRLYSVLERRFVEVEYLAGATYTIADMAVWPWIALHERQEQQLEDKPNLRRWFLEVSKREAVKKGRALHSDLRREPTKRSIQDAAEHKYK